MGKPSLRHNGVIADKSQIPPAACPKGNRKHKHAHIFPKPNGFCIGNGTKIRRRFVFGAMVQQKQFTFPQIRMTQDAFHALFCILQVIAGRNENSHFLRFHPSGIYSPVMGHKFLLPVSFPFSPILCHTPPEIDFLPQFPQKRQEGIGCQFRLLVCLRQIQKGRAYIHHLSGVMAIFQFFHWVADVFNLSQPIPHFSKIPRIPCRYSFRSFQQAGKKRHTISKPVRLPAKCHSFHILPCLS